MGITELKVSATALLNGEHLSSSLVNLSHPVRSKLCVKQTFIFFQIFLKNLKCAVKDLEGLLVSGVLLLSNTSR